MDGVNVNGREVSHERLLGDDVALRRERDVRVGEEANLRRAGRVLRLQTPRDVVVERHEGVRHRGREEILVHVTGLQLLVLGRVGLVKAILQPEGNLFALAELRGDLLRDVLRGRVVRDGHVEHCLALGDEVLRVMRERVAVRDANAVAEVAALKLQLAERAGVPRSPVVPHLEGRAVGEVQLAHFQRRVLRDALAKVRRQIPAAAPQVQQVRGGVVMGVVAVAREEDATALASHDERIGAQGGVGLRRLRQRGLQRSVCPQCLLADDERGCRGLERRRDGLGSLRERGLRAGHPLDVFNEVRRRLLLPHPRRGRDDHRHLRPAGISEEQVIAAARAGGLGGHACGGEGQGEGEDEWEQLVHLDLQRCQ